MTGGTTTGAEAYPLVPGYRIDARLGEGAMGRVYRGTHLASGTAVAIKTLHSNLDPSQQRALTNEWEVLKRVEHPLLVDERELLQLDSGTYLVMELIEGQSATQWVEQSTFEQRLRQLPGLLQQLCDVLAYLHGQDPPVIVRDLKPDNILVRPDGTIKLIDFGISRTLVANGRTEVGLKGFASAAYAPLEQYSSGSTTGVASDIYALGATTYHLLRSHPPDSAIDIMTGRIHIEQRLTQAGVPLSWASLVASAMRLKADQRPSLAQFREKIPAPPGQALPSRPVGSVSEPVANGGLGASWTVVAIVVMLALALLLFVL